MKIVKVTYTVKAGFAATNQANINTFIGDLRKINHPGLRYAAYLGGDGKTFTHLARFDNEATQKVLLELPSFKSFQQRRDESGLEAKPEIEEMQLVAASFPVFNEKNETAL